VTYLRYRLSFSVLTSIPKSDVRQLSQARVTVARDGERKIFLEFLHDISRDMELYR